MRCKSCSARWHGIAILGGKEKTHEAFWLRVGCSATSKHKLATRLRELEERWRLKATTPSGTSPWKRGLGNYSDLSFWHRSLDMPEEADSTSEETENVFSLRLSRWEKRFRQMRGQMQHCHA